MYIFSPQFEKEILLFIEKKVEDAFKKFEPESKLRKSDTDEYFTKKQACKFLNISLSGLNNYLKQGKIKKHLIGSRVLISKNELLTLLGSGN